MVRGVSLSVSGTIDTVLVLKLVLVPGTVCLGRCERVVVQSVVLGVTMDTVTVPCKV